MFPFLYGVCCCGEFVQVVLLRAFSVICYGHENQNINTSGKHLVEFYFTKYFNVTGANTILFTQSEKITFFVGSKRGTDSPPASRDLYFCPTIVTIMKGKKW